MVDIDPRRVGRPHRSPVVHEVGYDSPAVGVEAALGVSWVHTGVAAGDGRRRVVHYSGRVNLARSLWHANADLAAAAVAHPFVRGIADGSLSRDRFAGYVAQDAFFLESFARAYALAIAHSPDRAGLDAFADLLEGVRAELRLHESYAKRWGIDLGTVSPAPATSAYTDFLLATASLGGVGLTCAAMTPCMRLYAHLGQRLAAGTVDERYAEWVTTYADPGFESLAATLERLLDTYADGDGPAVAYRRAMRLEVAFFDAAYGG